MTQLLAVPIKRTSDVDVQKPLSNLIRSTYSSDRSIDVSGPLSELQKLRQRSVRQVEMTEACLDAMSCYYDQISSLESKVPGNEVNMAFKWRDAFDRGNLFGGPPSLSISSLAYERICALFNVAAMNSGIAAQLNLQSDENLQKAMKKLQLAAGIFVHLKHTVIGAIQHDPTPDLKPETLSVLGDLMVAQAQEMVALKSIGGKMKDQSVAKVCMQCDHLFGTVIRDMQQDAVKGIWEREWVRNVSGKQALYAALAQYHQSRVCNADKAIGEEIARLQYAQRLINQSMERSHNPDLGDAKEWLRRIDRALAEAKKDNDFIYHERVPDEKSLNPIEKVVLAKATVPLPERLGSNTADLFSDLCPLEVHQAATALEQTKSELVNGALSRLKEASSILNASLTSMNLPASLEDTSGVELPQSLKDKAQAVIDAGGIALINQMMQEIPTGLQRNKEILDEAKRLLDEEKSSDDQMRQHFGPKWSRTPSDKLTASFVTNTQKYHSILQNAITADKSVEEKYAKQRPFIEMLSQGASALQSQLPSSASDAVKGGAAVTRLRALMTEVDTLKAERQVIMSEISGVQLDAKTVFLNMFSKEGRVSEAGASKDILDKYFGPLQSQVTDNLAKQQQLLQEITTNHEIMAKESGSTGGGQSAREGKLKEWAAGYDAFLEIKSNLEEGIKFYNDFTQLLVTFQNKVSDFCFARRTEKEELLKDLTIGMSKVTLGEDLNPPAHHSTEASAAPVSPSRPPRKCDVPPRPPPPTTTTTTTSQPENPYAGAPAEAVAPSAPGAANPYAGAPAGYGNLPYPVQQGMAIPYQPYPFLPAYSPFPNPAQGTPYPTQYPYGIPPHMMALHPQGYYPLPPGPGINPQQQQQPGSGNPQ